MRYSWEELHQFAADCFMRANVPEEDAKWCAEVLVRADFTGVSTHGLSRLAAYIRAIRRGSVNPRPKLTFDQGDASVLLLDADNALGPVAGRAAMQKAIDTAKQTGIGMVTVRRANHAGSLSTYIDLATHKEMIGFAFSNAQPAIPPWGGAKAYFGTNPIAFGAPSKQQDPVVIDLATSKVARGNIILAAKSGRPIPEGWAIDEWGHPTTDAAAALRGAVLPMAGAKGYALALMVEILCGVLSGAEFGPRVGSLYDTEGRESGTGMCLIAVNPASFLNPESFLSRMDQLINEIHEIPPVEEGTSVRLPGERRALNERIGREKGIVLDENTREELNRLAMELGVSWKG